MIVVDVWVVPRLWRSELRDILATYLRLNQIDLADAALIFQRATELVWSSPGFVDSSHATLRATLALI
jgi:hypothetical protein